MIKQSLVNKDILEKKFKVLRTSIMLGNINNRNEIMQEYEETARMIDENKRNAYEEILASKMYTTNDIYEEKDRLDDLISFIEKRCEERNNFIDDYMKVTTNFLDDLPKPSMENELFDLKSRYENINEYISNVERINFINEELQLRRKELEECYENKANNEIVDSKLEDELIDEFNKIISKDEYYNSLNYMDIDSKIEEIEVVLKEKKDVMETFISSYEALKNAGISGAEREEYLSYVGDAKKDYYNELEKKYMLEIYKSVLDKEESYDKLYQKRAYLDNLFDNRNKDREELGIYDNDKLQYFIDLCNEHLVVIKSQKLNIDKIDKLILNITDLESELDTLEESNNRDEIVSILDEFKVEQVKSEKIELPNEEEIHEEVIAKNEESTPKKEPNLVVKVTEPVKLNIKTASDTAKLVMKKVVVVLEPKKYGNKKDKLKEAEKELEERKKKEQEEKKLKEEKLKKKEDDIFEFDSTPFDDVNTNETKDDIFEFDNTPFDDSDTVINLDTVLVNDKEVKNTKELEDVKLDFLNEEVSVPTEIFVEEPKEETRDLFKETDPFLDDNQFERNVVKNKDEVGSSMPRILNIGSVKPNNMISKIEEVQKENNDIILPTMGLTKDKKEEVPIVSENYRN